MSVFVYTVKLENQRNIAGECFNNLTHIKISILIATSTYQGLEI